MRLTVAQALVRFLTVQYSQRDGVSRRFFAGCFGIFGHGNIAGLGQALLEAGDELQYYQGRNEQAHGARRCRVRACFAPAARLRLHVLDRARRDQYGDRRGAGDGQPAASAAAARRRVRHPACQPGAAGTGRPAVC